MPYSAEFQEKVQLFQDAAGFENRRVPNLSNDYTWKIFDSGYTHKGAYFDSKKMGKLVCENHERYNFDAYLDLGTRNHFPQMQALGGGSYVLNEQTGSINVTDAPTLKPEEYEDFAKDPMAYLNILFARKFPALQRALQAGEKTYIADVYCALIGHQVMNRKQFEQLYLPQLRQILDACAQAGKMVYLYVEGSIARFAEYFKDVPKGCAIMHLEIDDIFEMRKLLPGMCLAGGMTTDLLGSESPERCVAHAEKLVSELGPGYVMSQNKMLSFKNDCRRENLLAVNNFVREYTL